jgi:hypothetical protein
MSRYTLETEPPELDCSGRREKANIHHLMSTWSADWLKGHLLSPATSYVVSKVPPGTKSVLIIDILIVQDF